MTLIKTCNNASIIETCNNTYTYGDLLVEQFMQSVKGLAFDWYVDLPSASIGRGNGEQILKSFIQHTSYS